MKLCGLIELYMERPVDFSSEVLIEDKGEGSYIDFWGITEKVIPSTEQLQLLTPLLEAKELESIKTAKILQLSVDCSNDIFNGFYSTAYNGVNKFYSFDALDQGNMTGMLIFTIISFITGIHFYWKAKDELISYEWSASQVFKLCLDAYTTKLAKMRKYHELRYLVSQVATAEEIEAITWEG